MGNFDKKVYIFDLYGTLLNVHTDEGQDILWSTMAEYLSAKGQSYTAKGLKQEYLRLVKKETAALEKELHTDYAEIELGYVFLKLLGNVDRTEAIGETVLTDPTHMDLSQKYSKDLIEMAQLFRETSRLKLRPYADTIPALEMLKQQGKKVYLLSNAQTLFTVPEMEQCKLMQYFDGIFISSEQKIRKPNKEFMERLLSTYHIDREDAVMIGNDMTSDMRIAMECGMNGVFLNTDKYRMDEIEAQIEKQQQEVRSDMRPYVIASGHLLELFDMV